MLVISQHLIDEMVADAQEGYPYEICGLLLGRVTEQGEDAAVKRVVVEVHRATNLNTHRANDRYEMSPDDYRRIEADGQSRRLEIVGIYHSHPDHPSAPSETDRARAEEIWGDGQSWSYVILEVSAGKVASWRSWVLNQAQFEAESIELKSA